jgi:serine/threonine protein kinase
MSLNRIEALYYKRWKNGYCYFTAYKGKQKVFIKVDTKLKNLSNEIKFYDLLYDELSKYMIEKIDFFENKKVQILLLEYKNSRELTEFDLIYTPKYLKDILFILTTIYKKGIIHRDIKLDNFLITDNNLKIIDFTFATSWNSKFNFKELDINSNQNLSLLKYLGEGLNPEKFIWNDFFSIGKIIENILKNYPNINLETKEILSYYKNKFYFLSKNRDYRLYEKEND